MWAVKHKSGRVLFVTSDERTANNRRDMGWIVEKVIGRCQKCNGTGMADSGGVQPWGEPILIECDCAEEGMASREQFNFWFQDYTGVNPFHPMASTMVERYWVIWQASREAMEVELPSIEDKKWYSSWHGKFREEAFWLEVKRRLVKLGLKVKQ